MTPAIPATIQICEPDEPLNVPLESSHCFD